MLMCQAGLPAVIDEKGKLTRDIRDKMKQVTAMTVGSAVENRMGFSLWAYSAGEFSGGLLRGGLLATPATCHLATACHQNTQIYFSFISVILFGDWGKYS